MSVTFPTQGTVTNDMIVSIKLEQESMTGVVEFNVTWLGGSYNLATDPTVFTYDDLDGAAALSAWARAAIEAKLGL